MLVQFIPCRMSVHCGISLAIGDDFCHNVCMWVCSGSCLYALCMCLCAADHVFLCCRSYVFVLLQIVYLCTADRMYVCCRSCVCVLPVMCLCASGHVFVCCRSCVCVLQIMCKSKHGPLHMCLYVTAHVWVVPLQKMATSCVCVCYRSCLSHTVYMCVCHRSCSSCIYVHVFQVMFESYCACVCVCYR